MKKIASILVASLMLIGVNAMGQASIGAGFLSSAETVKAGSSSNERAALNGFYVGMVYTLPIASNINFTPGVYFGMASKSNAGSIYGLLVEKRQDSFINIPMHFSFNAELGSGLAFFAYAGPSASIAVSSKAINGKSTTELLSDDYNKRFDVMLGGGIGLKFNDMIRFQVGYDFGMLNRASTDRYTVKRNQLTAGVAFLF